MVGGLAQVSMNLADYTRTSPRQAFDAVRAAAGRLGAEIDRSELIGLIPQEATTGWSPEDIHLEGFSESRILECRLREAGLMEG
jgi:glutamate formiminotransferase